MCPGQYGGDAGKRGGLKKEKWRLFFSFKAAGEAVETEQTAAAAGRRESDVARPGAPKRERKRVPCSNQGSEIALARPVMALKHHRFCQRKRLSGGVRCSLLTEAPAITRRARRMQVCRISGVLPSDSETLGWNPG